MAKIVTSKINKTAEEEFPKLLEHLRTDVFPYMSDDELDLFKDMLYEWLEDNMY